MALKIGSLKSKFKKDDVTPNVLDHIDLGCLRG